MKQGTKFLLPVAIGTDVDMIRKIEFILVQGSKEMTWEYPSDRTIREDNVINLVFTEEESWELVPYKRISLDTRITLNDSEYQPETKIATVVMHETLFHRDVEEE